MIRLFVRGVACLLVALSLALLAASVGGSSSRAASATFGAAKGQQKPVTLTIGNLLELTGPLSAFGPPMEKAANLAAAVANRASRRAHVPLTVKVVSADTQGDPQAALQAARTLVNDGASCLTGPATTPETVAIANGVTARKNILLWPQAGSSAVTTLKDNDTVFRSVANDVSQAKAEVTAIKLFLHGANGKTVSVAYRNEPYGEDLATLFGKDWQAAGGKIQGPVAFDPNEASYDSEAAKIVSGKPDAFYIVDYPDTWVKMGAALLRTGKFDANKLFVSTAMAFSSVPANIPAASLEGAKGVRPGTVESTKAYKEFDQLWNQAGGVAHYSLDANTFDSVLACFLAAVGAHSNDPAKIKGELRKVTNPPGPTYSFANLFSAVKALERGKKINFEGVSGALTLDKAGDPTGTLYDIFQFSGGTLHVQRQVHA